jgi:hypothetical protein
MYHLITIKTMKTMRNYMMMAALLLAASMAFTACGGSDDDNDNGGSSAKNVITIGTTDYDILTTYAYHPVSRPNNVYLAFLGNGLTYDATKYIPSGKGPYLAFQIYMTSTDNWTSLVPGKYTLINGLCASDYSASTPSYGDYSLSGEVTIAKSGTLYTITFTGSYNGANIKATYKGGMPIYL